MIIVLLPIVLCVVCIIAASRALRQRSKGEERVKVADTNARHYPYALTLTLSGMDSAAAALRSQNELNRLEGTWADESDWEAGTLHVLSKEMPDTSLIRQRLSQAGCTVLSVKKG
jgi:hypothetical protein